MDVTLVDAFSFLFQPARLKCTYGGRGSGKSLNYTDALLTLTSFYNPSYTQQQIDYVQKSFEDEIGVDGRLIRRALMGPMRILCVREILNSIKDSVHQTIVDRININKFMGYTATNNAITHLNGSNYAFKGLYRNTNEIKSFAGVDIMWMEEAENISDSSWDLSTATIRKESSYCCNAPVNTQLMICEKCKGDVDPDNLLQSEIWVSYNTRYIDDPTYQRTVISPPKKSIVKLVNYDQNPYFPLVLEQERQEDLKYRPNIYKNKWLGEPLGTGRKVWPDFIPHDYPDGHIRVFEWDLVRTAGNCFMSMDPAQHYYPACVWVAMIPKNANNEEFYHWIYAEWPTFDMFGEYFCNVRKTVMYTESLEYMAKQIYIKDGTSEYGLKVQKRFIDTRFAKGSGSGNVWTNSTIGIVQEFAKKENGGLIFDLPDESKIDIAKHTIRSDMQCNNLAPRSQFNEPNYYIAPWCKNTIYAMANHRLEDGSEKELEKNKDFSDANKIYYAGVSDWKYINPIPKPKIIKPYYGGSGNDWMGA